MDFSTSVAVLRENSWQFAGNPLYSPSAKSIDMNYYTLRKRLSTRIREDDIHEITFHAQGIEDEPVKQALYRLLFDADKRISDNAAWVFARFDLYSNRWLYSKRDELTEEAMHTPSDTKRRLLFTLLLRQPFTPDNFRTDFFDFCLNRILAPEEPTAVRCLSVKLAYEQCRFFPELLTELQMTLEMTEREPLSAGMRTACRNTLKAIQNALSV